MLIPFAGPEDSPPQRPPGQRRGPLALAGAVVIAVLLAILALTHHGGAPQAQAGSPAPSQPAAAAAPSRPTATASRPKPAPRRHAHQHSPLTPASAVNAVQRAILTAENNGAIQPQAATDLHNQLTGISQSISQGNLHDAGHKAGDLLHHIGDLTRNGQISTRGLTTLGPSLSQLTCLLPQQS